MQSCRCFCGTDHFVLLGMVGIPSGPTSLRHLCPHPRSQYDFEVRLYPDVTIVLVLFRTHRHEPPVAGGDITIVSESPTEIVVDKPCTIPIHPCGSYRYHGLTAVLCILVSVRIAFAPTLRTAKPIMMVAT